MEIAWGLWRCVSDMLRAMSDTQGEAGERWLAENTSRRKQMPVLTVANSHGSVMVGHGNEVIHIRPCWQVTDKLGHVQTSEHKTQKSPLNVVNSGKAGVTQQPLLCDRPECRAALKPRCRRNEWTATWGAQGLVPTTGTFKLKKRSFLYPNPRWSGEKRLWADEGAAVTMQKWLLVPKLQLVP